MPLTLSVAEAPSMRLASRPGAALLVATALGLALLWWGQGGFVFTLDDASITLHNARVLLDGRDPNYGVSALVGATSLVHLALVTALAAVFPAEAASYLVSCAGVLLFLSALLAMARQRELTPAEGAALAFAGLVSGAVQWLNGLETGLAMAGVAWALVLAAGKPSRRLALLCGLLPFLRPELGLLSLVLMARQAWLRNADAPWSRSALGAVMLDAALVLCAAAPWLAWSAIETGAILPATMAAKQAFFGIEPHSLPVAIALTLTFLVAATGPAMAALALMRRDSLTVGLWTFVAVFALGFAATTPEILTHNDNRYGYVLLPVALFAVASLRRTLVTIALIGQCAAYTALLPGVVIKVRTAQAAVADYRAVAEWAQANLPPGSRLLIHDAGMIAYATDLPLTDLVGLKSPESIADHRRWTAPSGGAERPRALDAIARRAGATHAIILDDRPHAFWADLADDMRRAGWSLDLAYRAEPMGRYRLYTLTPPAEPLTAHPAPDSAETHRPR